MKHLKRLLIALAIIIGLFFIVTAFLPAKKHIEDSISIVAPREIIFNNVNSLKGWEAWSPFLQMDSAMTSTYSGPDNGVGAKQVWKSPVNGDGSMTITESKPGEYIKLSLELMKGESVTSDWKFEDKDGFVKVTWAVDLEELSYPLGRVFALFMPAMMHGAFQLGLGNLKTLSEQQAVEIMQYKTGPITIKEIEPWAVLAVKDSASTDRVGEILDKAFGEVQELMNTQKISCVSPPYAKYFVWDDKVDKFVVEAGFPVAEKAEGSGRVYYKEYPGGRVVWATHYGAYETSFQTYLAIEDYIKANKLTQKGEPWEVYVNDPGTIKDTKKFETQIFYPID